MEVNVRIAKWGNSLAVRIPKDVVEALDLKEGDEIAFKLGDGKVIEVSREVTRDEALKRLRGLAKPLPPGWKFDRDEANAR